MDQYLINMKKRYFLAIIFLFGSCSSWKNILIAEGNYNTAVQNAVHDFLNTSIHSKEGNVFSVDVESVNNDIIRITILNDQDKLVPTPENRKGTNKPYFPTNYIEQEEKLFYWYDSTAVISDELIWILSRYNHIDSINVNEIVEIRGVFDDSKKAVEYYFCKNNLLKYKKNVTRIGRGNYEPPKIKCKP